MTKNEAKAGGENKPGYFVSELDEYPGWFQLPHPFLNRHIKVWWDIAVKPTKTLDRFDLEMYRGDYDAAVRLIRDYGEWHVDGVTLADLEGEDVPAAVFKWVSDAASGYIFPFLPFNMLRRAYGTT